MIIGVTHDKDGSVRMHRTVTCKVAIGLPPDANSNYPKKLDHFVFLRQAFKGKELGWEIDRAWQDHYGAACREFWIVLLDDDPAKVLRAEYAAYVKTRCWCRGDGLRAERRTPTKPGESPPRGDFAPYPGPCAEAGCPDLDRGACKPSADLYFMLQDFPELGTICRIHTSSYQSIRQLWSGLQDLAAVTGGRLMGVRCKLFVAPARNVFEQNGVEKTGTKQVLGIRLGAQDVPALMSAMAETARQFRGLQKQLAGRVLEIEEEEETRAPDLAAEFYGTTEAVSAAAEPDPEQALRERANALLEAGGFNQAQRSMRLEKHKGRMAELVAQLEASSRGQAGGTPAPITPEMKPPAAGDAAAQAPAAAAETVSPQPVAGQRPQSKLTF